MKKLFTTTNILVCILFSLQCSPKIDTIATKKPNVIPRIKDEIESIRIFQFETDSLNPEMFKGKENKEIKIYHSRDVLLLEIDKREEIDDFLSFLTDSLSPVWFCGYHGKIKLKIRPSDSIEVKFNLDKGCRHYVYSYGDDYHSRKMSQAGAMYIQKLLNERSILSQ
jgi:hypothetical protein